MSKILTIEEIDKKILDIENYYPKGNKATSIVKNNQKPILLPYIYSNIMKMKKVCVVVSLIFLKKKILT
jgi:hypothetical protein